MKENFPKKASQRGEFVGIMRNLNAADKSLIRRAFLACNMTVKLVGNGSISASNLQIQNTLYRVLQKVQSDNRLIPRAEMESLIKLMKVGHGRGVPPVVPASSVTGSGKNIGVPSEDEKESVKEKIPFDIPMEEQSFGESTSFGKYIPHAPRPNPDFVASSPLVDQRSPEEKAEELRLSKNFDWGPFPRIPNCKEFRIKVSGFEEIMSIFGLSKRKSPNIHIERYDNGNLVHYAKRMITRLRDPSLSEHTYWTTVHMLMARSRVFQMMAVSKNFPRYHREQSLHSIFCILDTVTSVMEEGLFNIAHRRVYIPKPSKVDPVTGILKEGVRPLGVPEPAWRVLLSLLTFFLVTRYSRLIPDWQHAYVPKRGVLTAWKDVLLKVKSHKYIWEFDLKSFFDNVPISGPLSILRREGAPSWVLSAIGHMASVGPTLPSVRQMPEDQVLSKHFAALQSKTGWEGESDVPGFRVVGTKVGSLDLPERVEEVLGKVKETTLVKDGLDEWPLHSAILGTALGRTIKSIDAELSAVDEEKKVKSGVVVAHLHESTSRDSTTTMSAKGAAKLARLAALRGSAESSSDEAKSLAKKKALKEWELKEAAKVSRIEELTNFLVAHDEGFYNVGSHFGGQPHRIDIDPMTPGIAVVTERTAWADERSEILSQKDVDVLTDFEDLRLRGYPQGAPISAFLSVLALSELEFGSGVVGQEEVPKVVMYADDGILYSDSPFDPQGVTYTTFERGMKRLGIEISWSKCGWIRKGEWVSPLKFLGLVYDGVSDTLKSSTRKGSSVKFDKENLIKATKLEAAGVKASFMSRIKDWSAPLSGWGVGSLTLERDYWTNPDDLDIEGVPVRPVRDWKQEETATFSAAGAREEVMSKLRDLLIGDWSEGPLDVESRFKESYSDFTDDRIFSPFARYLSSQSAWALEGWMRYYVRYQSGDLGTQIDRMMTEGVTWEDTLNSRLWGWIVSKMQWKGFEDTVVHQDFMLGWKAGTSWVARRSQFEWNKRGSGGRVFVRKGLSLERIPLDFANSTSLAFRDIIEQYSNYRVSEDQKQKYIRGVYTLAELNELRKLNGRPPLKAQYVRKLRLSCDASLERAGSEKKDFSQSNSEALFNRYGRILSAAGIKKAYESKSGAEVSRMETWVSQAKSKREAQEGSELELKEDLLPKWTSIAGGNSGYRDVINPQDPWWLKWTFMIGVNVVQKPGLELDVRYAGVLRTADHLRISECVYSNHGQRRSYHWRRSERIRLSPSMALTVLPVADVLPFRIRWDWIPPCLVILCLIFTGVCIEVTWEEGVVEVQSESVWIEENKGWIWVLIAVTLLCVVVGAGGSGGDSGHIPLILGTGLYPEDVADNANLIRSSYAGEMSVASSVNEAISPVLSHGYWE